VISGYLGSSEDFDHAIADFAIAYADQNDKDHQRLLEAVSAGRVLAVLNTDSAPLRMITEAAGLGTDWVPRELRHTFVSLLSSDGMPGSQRAGDQCLKACRIFWISGGACVCG